MKHRDAAFGAKRPKLVLELARFIQRLIDEGLDNGLAERRELAAPEAAKKALHAREADAVDLMRLLVEHDHPCLVEDRANVLRLAALVVVVAEDSEHGNRA